ncbi:protein bicaudal D homolog 2-like isoform X2 [Rhopilema esculentum]|uniref:protein bicaudal D homolog 2-like isoform X2 n=1 Tax=Rhopilema esculentum TaxID=499914 RepID=UPI0031CF36A4
MDNNNEQLQAAVGENEKLSKAGDKNKTELLEESQTRELDLVSKTKQLEIDLRSAKRAEKACRQENEDLKVQHATVQNQLKKLNEVKVLLQREIRELKQKDVISAQEYSELEEENIGLQKQLSTLKGTLVEYEGLKVENKSLLDEVDNLQLQFQMANEGKEQYHKQLNEALETVREQRERNNLLQKELQEVRQEQAMRSWNIESGEVNYASDEEKDEHPIIRKITEEYRTKSPAPNAGVVDDLMKELQISEVRELEEQLKVLRGEKDVLVKELNDRNAHLSRLQSDLDAVETITEAKILCDSLDDSEETNEREFAFNNQLREIEELKKQVKQHYEKEIGLQGYLKESQKEHAKLQSEIGQLRKEKDENEFKLKEDSNKLSEEIRELKTKLREAERTIKNLQDDVRTMSSLAGEAQGGLNCTQDELSFVSKDLAKLYQHVIVTSGELPNSPPVTPQPKAEQPLLPGTGKAVGKSGPKEHIDLSKGSAEQCYKLITNVKDQVRSLTSAIEKAVARSREEGSRMATSNHDEASVANDESLREQILKLQSLLATKREQISTLRTVLKANKSTYEVALANLKSRYENDKAVQTEAMAQLKRQIKALKSECQTFASLRSMFAGRCEEYVNQLDELQRKLNSAEEEKATLNHLLKQAIHQKIALTQRLEEFELARERLRAFTRKSTSTKKPSNNPKRPITRV